jgi:SnoaL-like domain
VSALPVEDALAIHELYARQSHAIDAGDGHGWAATFTDDGVFASPSYPAAVQGTPALVSFVDDLSIDSKAMGHSLQHWIGNLRLSPTGPEDVEAVAYLSLVAVTPGQPPVPLRNVWLTDRLVRSDAGWRLSRRDVATTPNHS